MSKAESIHGGFDMTKPFGRIVVDPEICLGQPVIRGLRITVAFVLKLLASGMTNEAILKAYPELKTEDILQTIEYAAWLAGEFHRPMPAYAEREMKLLASGGACCLYAWRKKDRVNRDKGDWS